MLRLGVILIHRSTGGGIDMTGLVYTIVFLAGIFTGALSMWYFIIYRDDKRYATYTEYQPPEPQPQIPLGERTCFNCDYRELSGGDYPCNNCSFESEWQR